MHSKSNLGSALRNLMVAPKQFLASRRSRKRMAQVLEDSRISLGMKKPTAKQKREYEKRHSLVKGKKRLSGSKARKAKKTLDKAYLVDIACGAGLSKLADYARKHSNRILVGIDLGKLRPKLKRLVKSTPNLFFIQAEAIEALKLVEPNSKRIINMENFPYFDFGTVLRQNIEYRHSLFEEIFRVLKPGGTLALTTDFADLARKELEKAGFKVGKSRLWGQKRLKMEDASPTTKSLTARMKGSPQLVSARKPRK